MLPDAAAGVLQVVQVDVDVPDVRHGHGLVGGRPGAAVEGSQQGGLHPDLPGPEPEGVRSEPRHPNPNTNLEENLRRTSVHLQGRSELIRSE